jgi:aminoglycoside phosphotransferase family enzyme/predicted kinase
MRSCVTDTDDSFMRARERLARTADEVVETSCALVFLTGDRALKLKKPVDFGFLDFTTPQKRRWAIGRELEFNRRTAPDVYRAIREVEGEAVLEMRRFDTRAVLATRPDQVDGDLAEALGRTIARFHAGAERAPRGGGAANIDYVAKSNAHMIGGFARELGATRVAELEAATHAALAKVAGLLDARRDAGFARRCHGDLHLGNIFVEAGRPVLFDCIEFNDRLSEIDVLYDLAFLVMDLGFRNRREAACRVLNAYLDEASRTFGEDLWSGLEALPLFLSIRAGVRCHVAAHNREVEPACDYLETARRLLEPGAATLTAVGGFSGSGKSTWARRRAPELGSPPGAVVLRTDEIRKRLFGMAPTDPLPPEAYDATTGERVYQAAFAAARAGLKAGRAVVIDAAFLEPERRSAAEAAARDAGVAFDGVWLEVPADELRRRVATRRGDASDADTAVLERQLARGAGPIAWRRTPG